MKDVYLRISPYECGKRTYFGCPLYEPMPPKFRANPGDMFSIGTTDNAPNRCMALEYNSKCSLDEAAKKLKIQSLCNTCGKCGHKPDCLERNYVLKNGRRVLVQPKIPRALFYLNSYDPCDYELRVPEFLTIERALKKDDENYFCVILTVNPYECTFDFTNQNNNESYFNIILKTIAMRDKLVIKR